MRKLIVAAMFCALLVAGAAAAPGPTIEPSVTGTATDSFHYKFAGVFPQEAFRTPRNPQQPWNPVGYAYCGPLNSGTYGNDVDAHVFWKKDSKAGAGMWNAVSDDPLPEGYTFPEGDCVLSVVYWTWRKDGSPEPHSLGSFYFQATNGMQTGVDMQVDYVRVWSIN